PAGHAAARWTRRRPAAVRPAFVVSAHGPDMIHVAQRSSIGRRACVSPLRGADLVLANSAWSRRRCLALAGAPVPVSVVHLGADLVPAPVRRSTGCSVVTVAHLQARKHHDVVLRALARLEP